MYYFLILLFIFKKNYKERKFLLLKHVRINYVTPSGVTIYWLRYRGVATKIKSQYCRFFLTLLWISLLPAEGFRQAPPIRFGYLQSGLFPACLPSFVLCMAALQPHGLIVLPFGFPTPIHLFRSYIVVIIF